MPSKDRMRQRAPVVELVAVDYRDAAKMLSVGINKVSSLVAAGELEFVMIGGSKRVPVDSIRAYVARLPRGSGPGEKIGV
jgi:excisionase family DNA binding protein